jgi:hypothetical protein
MQKVAVLQGFLVARSERFELPALGIEIQCSTEGKSDPNRESIERADRLNAWLDFT